MNDKKIRRHWRVMLSNVAAGALLTACGSVPLDQEGAEVDPEATPISEQDEKLVVNPGLTWPNGNVPVCWDPNKPPPAAIKAFIKDAITRSLSRFTNIKITGWNDCPSSTFFADRIRLEYDTGAMIRAGLGKTNNNFVNYNFDFPTNGGDRRLKAVIVHEFIHALGVHHEQVRADTPLDCNMSEARTAPAGWVNFGPYDPASLMNYCNYGAFFDAGMLSDNDIAGLRNYYGTKAATTSRRNIIWENRAAKTAQVWRMASPGSVQTAGVSVDIGDTTVIGSGDFNGDGKGELLLSNFASTEQALYSRPVNGTVIGPATFLGSVPIGMAFGGVADMNADGRDDLWFRHPISNKLIEWRMNGATHTSVTLTTPAAYLGKTWAADLNGDKRADYVKQNSARQVFTYIRSSTADTFTAETLKDPAPGWGVGQVEAVADFDGDGKAEIYIPDSIYQYLWMLEDGKSYGTIQNIDPSLRSPYWLPFGLIWEIEDFTHVGDIDGDGRADFIGRDFGDNKLVIGHLNVNILTRYYPTGAVSFDWAVKGTVVQPN